ncbi:hypothetical protein BK011_07490 [Tenericutes bacterium MZ-XQ]|nr:hypothetical protein BK011_07490 [Tenericutes bacterium MZ-XQ]
MYKVKDMLSSNYELITNRETMNNEFQGVYATDLLSSAIKHMKHKEALITLITSQTTISLAVMLDVELVIIVDNQDVEQKFIDRANTENIALVKTAYMTHEVIIDLFQRGFI